MKNLKKTIIKKLISSLCEKTDSSIKYSIINYKCAKAILAVDEIPPLTK